MIAPSRPNAQALFLEAARRVFALPETSTPYEWAKRHGKYVKDAVAYDYNPDDVPYTRGILDAVVRPGVRQVTLMASEQMTKTEIAYKILGYHICHKPGRWLVVYPNRQIGRRQNREKFTPTILKTPCLAQRVQKAKRSIRGDGIDFDQMSITFANAPPSRPIDSNLEAFDYAGVWIDEFDRCHPDVLEIVRGRGKTRRDFLLLVTGTPWYAGQGIDREYFGTEEYEGSDQGRFLVPCIHPECRRYHVRDFGFVRWPGATRKEAWTLASRDKDADQEMVEQSAWMRCPFCRERLGREHNMRQLARGVWLTKGQSIDPWSGSWDGAFIPGAVHGPPSTSAHAGFHLPGLISCVPAGINPYGYVAKGYVAAKGKPDRQWLNRRHGTAHAERAQTVEIRDVHSRAIPAGQPGAYAKGITPQGALILTAAVDVQADHAYIEVVAWHPFARTRSVVWWGVAPWMPGTPGETLLAAIEQGFPSAADAKVKRVLARVIDSGDRTDEVYDLCRRWKAMGKITFAAKGVGLKGGAESMNRPVEVTRIDKLADGRPDTSGLELLRFNSFFLKGLAVRAMRGQHQGPTNAAIAANAKDPRGWSAPVEGDAEGELAMEALGTAGGALGMTSELRLPHNVDDKYLGQITAEQLVMVGTASARRPQWLIKPGRTGNHYFDCHVMNLALGERLGLRALAPAGAMDPAMTPMEPSQHAAQSPSTTQSTTPTPPDSAEARRAEIRREPNLETPANPPRPEPPPVRKSSGNPALDAARERARAIRERWRK